MASKTSESLMLSRSALRPILETALDAVVVMNPDGTVAEWNDRATEIFGWPQTEAVGRVMADLIIPERHRDAHRQGLALFLETGEAKILGKRIELSAVRKGGDEFPVELSVMPIRDRDGVLFVGFLRDITTQKLSHASLKQ